MVLITHGRLAEELVSSLEHVAGPQSNICAVCIGPDDDMERRSADIMECIHKVDEENGVLLLTDMFGGTPSNLAISIMEKANVEVVAGVNLPMLIKLAGICETETLDEAAVSAQEAGRKYIKIASQILAQNPQ